MKKNELRIEKRKKKFVMNFLEIRRNVIEEGYLSLRLLGVILISTLLKKKATLPNRATAIGVLEKK